MAKYFTRTSKIGAISVIFSSMGREIENVLAKPNNAHGLGVIMRVWAECCAHLTLTSLFFFAWGQSSNNIRDRYYWHYNDFFGFCAEMHDVYRDSILYFLVVPGWGVTLAILCIRWAMSKENFNKWSVSVQKGMRRMTLYSFIIIVAGIVSHSSPFGYTRTETAFVMTGVIVIGFIAFKCAHNIFYKQHLRRK